MADNDLNVLPSLFSSGSYEADAPFDTVVIKDKYYINKAIRTIEEMRSDEKDLYKAIFAPVSISEDDYPAILETLQERNGAIIVLMGLDGSKVYLPSTYLKSFPLVDGVSLERMCLIVDLGPCVPSLAAELGSTQEHIKSYVQAHLGISAEVVLGTVPTIGYVSKEQADTNEITRKNKITETRTDAIIIAQQEATITSQQAYIKQLEDQLKALTP